jgi:hypothetical protein
VFLHARAAKDGGGSRCAEKAKVRTKKFFRKISFSNNIFEKMPKINVDRYILYKTLNIWNNKALKLCP